MDTLYTNKQMRYVQQITVWFCNCQ